MCVRDTNYDVLKSHRYKKFYTHSSISNNHYLHVEFYYDCRYVRTLKEYNFFN